MRWWFAPPLQVKDVMAHLYFKAKESFAQQAPKEVRLEACGCTCFGGPGFWGLRGGALF